MIATMRSSLSDLTIERAKRREARIRQLVQERDEREAAIFARIPRLAEIKALQAEIGLDLARLYLKRPTRFKMTFEELRDWSLRLSREREELLRQHGIDPRELEVHWDCPKCQNTGWIRDTEAGETVAPPRKCSCLIQEEIEDLYRVAGLTGPLREHTFDRFDLTVYPAECRKHMAGVRDYCRRFAEAVAEGRCRTSLLLQGAVGLGKTFLASAIGNYVIAARRSVLYFTLAEFVDLIRAEKFEDGEDARASAQWLLEADLVILDDLGAEKVTEFVAQELFNLINLRLNRQMPMVVSTNLRASELFDTYGERIASRLLYGFEALTLEGEDVRRVLRLRAGER
ncbi:putative chromosome replication initiation protein [Symbiobacterium thermophilum IAM 14863]|uniref:Putative chromosome replication initiation protein n=2 Tax=Symbiobacterium thermophilum TaxID=2734 RepID=Q67JA8_SYMTH|nr:putative chromosome replication initiation protein [Symbiobacterium thermophilum IAM 14863]